MKRFILGTAFALGISSAASAQSLDSGYFVVVGSYKSEHQKEATANTVRVVSAANRCGFRPTLGWSNSFAGMIPERDVQVIGGYRRKSDAIATLQVVRRCVPDAYIKHTTNTKEGDNDIND
jgi:hypothetical protein